jgi:hypothetical protein
LLIKFTLTSCFLHKLTLEHIFTVSVYKYNCHVNLLLLSLIYYSFLNTASPQKRSLICNELPSIHPSIYLSIMHYSTWKDDVETFKSYWLHENILGRLQEGRILLTEQV